MKKKTAWILGGFFILWAVLVSTGIAFQKTDAEKQNGLTDVFDLSPAGDIFYVKHEDGIPSLRIFSEKNKTDKEVTRLPADQLVTDVDVSPDGSAAAFIAIQEGDVIETGEVRTDVYIVDFSIGRQTLLFKGNQAASSLEFSEDGNSLYFIGLASERAHSDIFRYDLSTGAKKRLTTLNSYSMSGLHVRADGTSALVLMQDETVDMFESKSSVWTVSLDGQSTVKPYTTPKTHLEVTDYAFHEPTGDMVYQAVANEETADTFQYELFRYNNQLKQPQALTSFGTYAGSPVFHPSGHTIYFMTDPNFAKGKPDYHLFKMNLDGSNKQEIVLSE
ncbi:TolB family protein [Domibacillus robiginosus]|uniref:TolB family protein n=1 Tax=Domibacillus robiginosus TaxID=1071054 RepID=UPI00067B5941|nr:PD40 domain-containing protein [Domibacillus robiginosus]